MGTADYARTILALYSANEDPRMADFLGLLVNKATLMTPQPRFRHWFMLAKRLTLKSLKERWNI